MRPPRQTLLAAWMVITMSILSVPVAQGIEEPEYELLTTVGEVEIREYVPTIQAVTVTRGSNSGFRRLAGYIFGGNESNQSIAMTAPVQQSLSGNQQEMAFTMPAEYSWDELPAPEDARVELREVPGRTAAVIRFGGWATSGKVKKMQRELVKMLDYQGIEMVSEPVLNQYNPPWTPPFMRRNEIMVEIAWDDAAER